ncbi:PBP1A family penicillin-binding protein [Bacillus sp. FJAT-42376]|uniref:transglycosylase domain-containing protein n=1 Tax=Bacillus sp. FJAT-42376 TaxID=2014076 RepID=UPI000F50C461|nr:PBP1A family penicillin-binding protein [Bacillus sp. FJAT-42376]AZB40949.1 PBP1A family penicillin-binding protein [Bacillus sp. FJAT-42376]
MNVIHPSRIRQTIKLVRALFFISLLLLALLSIAAGIILLTARLQGPPSLNVPQATIVFADDHSKLGETHYGEKRYWTSLKHISPYAVKATLAIEDRHYYEHHGFDFKRIAGAALADMKAMAKIQGASTITQQYARNLYLSHDKTWTRKLTEAFYTIRLEVNYSKEQILEGYLNTIYYGHGAYGIEAASKTYFGKSAKNLTLAEASMLAGIPKGPSQFSPLLNEKRAKERQRLILSSLVKAGAVSKEQAEAAEMVPLVYKEHKTEEAADTEASYFYDQAMRETARLLGVDQEALSTRGLKVYTTLDPDLQKKAERQLKEVIDPDSSIQAGIISMDPETGAVRAMTGGRDYKKSPFNRVTQALRQPGSTIKPLLYYAAIQNGFTPSTMMVSKPTVFEYDSGKSTYKPSNYNDYYANGPITLAEAIALSDNIYAVKTHLFIGPEKLAETARAAGITSKLPAIPSLALGTAPARLEEIVNAYGILANGGKQIRPVYVARIEDAAGNVLYQWKQHPGKQILNEQAAFVTTELMTGMFDKKLNSYTSVTGRRIAKHLTRSYAGKSGTTETDSWMIGYSPELVTGVWTGYDRDLKMEQVEERTYAKSIWAGFMEDALRGRPMKEFKPPEGVTGVYINPQNGKLAGPGCPVKRYVYYKSGTEPTETCTDHLEYKTEPAGKKQADEKKGFWNKFKFWD